MGKRESGKTDRKKGKKRMTEKSKDLKQKVVVWKNRGSKKKKNTTVKTI